MNRSFEAALAARLLWVNVQCFKGSICGLESEVEIATLAAYEKVDELAYDEAFTRGRYGANVPPMLQDVPQLAERYLTSYALNHEAELALQGAEKFELQNAQYLQDLADTYDEIESDLVAGWKADFLDDELPCTLIRNQAIV